MKACDLERSSAAPGDKKNYLDLNVLQPRKIEAWNQIVSTLSATKCLLRPGNYYSTFLFCKSINPKDDLRKHFFYRNKIIFYQLFNRTRQ